MYENYKIVITIPSGRRKYLEILLPYIIQQKGYVDEIHFWLNTTDTDDINYIKEVASKDLSLYKIIESKIPIKYASSLYHFWYTANDTDKIYIRFDDDICWLSSNFIYNLIQCRINNPKYFLIFPIIVNNDMNYGLIKEFGSENYFDWYKYPELVAQSHGTLLYMLKKNSLPQYTSNVEVPLNRSLNINSVCWFGKDIIDNMFLTDEEEPEISNRIPNQLSRPNLICTSAICSHLSFMSQRQYLYSNTKIYEKYKLLSKQQQG